MSDASSSRHAPVIATRVRGTRAVALACVIALVALGLAWELVIAPTGHGTLALKVLPLAFAVPGLLKWRLYTCRWLSLMVWLYVAEGLVRLRDTTPHVTTMSALELALALALFVACGLQVRWRLAAGHAAEAASAASATRASEAA